MKKCSCVWVFHVVMGLGLGPQGTQMYDSWPLRVSEIDLREMGLDIVKGYCNMILTIKNYVTENVVE